MAEVSPTSVNRQRGLLIGLDIGTSSTKGVLVDGAGRVVARAEAEYPLAMPQPGWTEQQPENWWQATLAVLAELAGPADDAIVGVGLTGQMHGAVFLDAAGEVIRPAILWNDQRTGAACEQIESVVGQQRLRRITGNPALTGFQAPKILWLRDNEPQHYARLAHVLLPKDYIRYRLSGMFATDVSDAAGTLLLDLETRDWSDDILQALEIPRSWLPAVHDSPNVCARIAANAARLTGLETDTPIVAGAGDNAAAAVGNGIVRSGQALVSLGTSGVVFAPSDSATPDTSGELHCFCHAVPGSYHLMGVSLSAGGSLQWFADQVLQADPPHVDRSAGNRFDQLVAAAGEMPAGADDLYFLPYLAGERTPHMDANARGAWIGLSLAHGWRHMLRAILEGVAFSLRDSLVRIQAQGVDPQRILLCGGGASSPLWRQIIAAVLDKPVAIQRQDQGPAYGAAVLASVGAGLHVSVAAAVANMTDEPQSVEIPDAALVQAYRPRYERFTRYYPALKAVSSQP